MNIINRISAKVKLSNSTKSIAVQPWPQSSYSHKPINGPMPVVKWVNKVVPHNSTKLPFNLQLTSKLLDNPIKEAVQHRIKLYTSCTALIDALIHHELVNDSFLASFDRVYQDIRKTTKILKMNVPDPIWGMDEYEGLMTEPEIRNHLMHELGYLMTGLEQEIRELSVFGLTKLFRQ
ncbi:hypothetical protein BC833DRAFT_645808 [Globomyces pollinis-pini]|nr:hypothetical protein BC833DRAFT_645808 [Globomyces pollinis-pini]